MQIVSVAPESIIEGLVSIYHSAFSVPPHFEGESEAKVFRERLREHATRDGFRLVIARDEDSIVGFAYGFASEDDGWTRRVVSPYLDDEVAEYWFSDCFELIELAVAPGMHGAGIGGKLHDELLFGVPQRTSVLFVNREAAPALGLYRSRGWRALVEDFRRPDSEVRSIVMGLRL